MFRNDRSCCFLKFHDGSLCISTAVEDNFVLFSTSRFTPTSLMFSSEGIPRCRKNGLREFHNAIQAHQQIHCEIESRSPSVKFVYINDLVQCRGRIKRQHSPLLRDKDIPHWIFLLLFCIITCRRV